MGLTLIIIDTEEPKEIFGAVADVCFGAIGDETIHGSPFADVVFQAGWNVTLFAEGVNIGHGCTGSNKDLGHADSAFVGGSVGIDGICGNCFVPAWNIGSGKATLKMFSKGHAVHDSKHLSGAIQGLFNDFHGSPSKVWFEGFVIMIFNLNFAMVG